MLRVTIDVIPFGDFECSERLGTLDIVNDLSGTEELGNYLVFLVDGAGEPIELIGEIEGFKRDREFWCLVIEALRIAYE
jgi:hypothetical protein